MFNAVASALNDALKDPSEQLFGLLAEIRDNLAESIKLLTEIREAVVEKPEPLPIDLPKVVK